MFENYRLAYSDNAQLCTSCQGKVAYQSLTVIRPYVRRFRAIWQDQGYSQAPKLIAM